MGCRGEKALLKTYILKLDYKTKDYFTLCFFFVTFTARFKSSVIIIVMISIIIIRLISW